MALNVNGFQIGWKVEKCSPQTELAAGLREQPKQFRGRLLPQFAHLCAAAIGVQIEGRPIGPAAKHQGANPGRSVSGELGPLWVPYDLQGADAWRGLRIEAG